MLSQTNLDILQQVQRQWRIEGSLERGLQNLVKMPAADRLLDRSSFLGGLCDTFSLQSPKDRLTSVQRIAFSALKENKQLADGWRCLLDDSFLEEFTQHKFRWIASSVKSSADEKPLSKSIAWPALNEQVQKVQGLVLKKWSSIALSLKERLETVWAFLSLLPQATTLFSSKEIDRLIHIEEALRGKEDATRWFDEASLSTDSNEWALIMEAMEANQKMAANLYSQKSNAPLACEAYRLSQLVENLPKGKNVYTHLKIGSQAFLVSQAWKYFKENSEIDWAVWEVKLAEVIQSGQLPDIENWLDKLLDDLMPKEVCGALDTMTYPVQLAHRLAGPLLPNRKRKIEMLHALFPTLLAECLESKMQGGAAKVLEPVLPMGVSTLSRLLTALPIDATHTLSQSLRQKSKVALESLAQSTVDVLAKQARYFLDVHERCLHRLPDEIFCREAVLKHIDDRYKTPASVLIKIHRHEKGHFEVTVVSSGATVGSCHPKSLGNRSCPFFFPQVTQNQLDGSFFHRLLEWPMLHP